MSRPPQNKLRTKGGLHNTYVRKLGQFISTEVVWADDPEVRPGAGDADGMDILTILGSILRELKDTELQRYATEHEEDGYFEQIWKGVDNYRRSLDYFDGSPELICCEINHFADNDEPLKSDDIDYIKAALARDMVEFHYHIDQIRNVLEKRAEILGMIKDRLKIMTGWKKKDVGQQLDSGMELSQQYISNAIENSLYDRLGYIDPLMHHHLGTAFNKQVAHDGARAFLADTKAAREYFIGLAKHNDTNIAACKAILRLGKRFEQQVDRWLEEQRPRGREV